MPPSGMYMKHSHSFGLNSAAFCVDVPFLASPFEFLHILSTYLPSLPPKQRRRLVSSLSLISIPGRKSDSKLGLRGQLSGKSVRNYQLGQKANWPESRREREDGQASNFPLEGVVKVMRIARLTSCLCLSLGLGQSPPRPR